LTLEQLDTRRILKKPFWGKTPQHGNKGESFLPLAVGRRRGVDVRTKPTVIGGQLKGVENIRRGARREDGPILATEGGGNLGEWGGESPKKATRITKLCPWGCKATKKLAIIGNPFYWGGSLA